ncbi:hypothetical protein EJ110_NYTH45402 [Nymphaea thermarum]|nr:hypothetical protein EJ110_NYTH45402 [Nymphaea thermarum]
MAVTHLQTCSGTGVPNLPSLSMDAKNNDAAVLPPATRTYECKKCHRQFHSFQALGGHSSRCKMQFSDVGVRTVQKRSVTVGPHKCSICGRCLSTGQALGGHMTLHRRQTNNLGIKKPLDIDLNLPPPADDDEEEEVDVKLMMMKKKK